MNVGHLDLPGARKFETVQIAARTVQGIAWARLKFGTLLPNANTKFLSQHLNGLAGTGAAHTFRTAEKPG
jgi:hypothetical protein